MENPYLLILGPTDTHMLTLVNNLNVPNVKLAPSKQINHVLYKYYIQNK